MKKENTPIVVTGIVSGTVILLAMLSLFIFVPVSTSSQDTVTVQGTSTMKVLPDLVSVHFSIQTNGSTSSEANAANTAIYNNLTQSLMNLGFEKSQIGTENFNVYPDYTYNKDGTRTLKGYTATHTVKVEMPSNKTNLLSAAVDAGINSGAGISYIDFELSAGLQSTYKAQALESASKDARVKADAVAAGFNKRIGKLVSVKVDDYNYMPWIMYSASGNVEASSVRTAAASITPSEQDVTATVSATYKLA